MSIGRWRQKWALGLTSVSIPAGVSGGTPDFLCVAPTPPTLPAAVLHPAGDPSVQLWRRDWPGGSWPSWTGNACCLPSTVGEVVFTHHSGSVAGGGQTMSLGTESLFASQPPGQSLCGLGKLFSLTLNHFFCHNCIPCRVVWRRKWQPTPRFLTGESHGQRSLVGYSPWGHKELDMTEVI